MHPSANTLLCMPSSLLQGCTLVAVATVDHFGRKALLIEGGAQMFAALASMAAILGAGFKTYGAALPDAKAAAVLFLICEWSG